MSIRYDPFSPEIRKNPFPHYAQLREEAPVHRLSERLWAISRYDDCSFVMRNPDLFSSSATRLMMMGGLQSGMQADEAELREARRRRQHAGGPHRGGAGYGRNPSPDWRRDGRSAGP